MRAVNTSAILGWLIVAAPISAGTTNGGFVQFLGVMIWAAIIGLPISFAVSWVVSAPILDRVMRSNITWFRAALWGGVIAFFVALLSIAIGRFYGWVRSVNPNSFSQVGGGDKVREIDGILTAYGWLLVLQNTGAFVIGGVFVALAVRCVIGPGQKGDT